MDFVIIETFPYPIEVLGSYSRSKEKFAGMCSDQVAEKKAGTPVLPFFSEIKRPPEEP